MLPGSVSSVVQGLSNLTNPLKYIMIFGIFGVRFLKKEWLSPEGNSYEIKWFFLFLILLLILPPFSVSQTRDSGKLYKVAILPFVINSQENLDYLREGIYDILASRITVEGRIEVIDRSMVERALYEDGPPALTREQRLRLERGLERTTSSSAV